MKVKKYCSFTEENTNCTEPIENNYQQEENIYEEIGEPWGNSQRNIFKYSLVYSRLSKLGDVIF